MNATLKSYVEGRNQDGLDIGKTVELFRRYAYIEQSCVRALAGWFIKIPSWEAKLKIGYCLFSHAERVYELNGRLEELRGGHREANMDPVLDRAGEEIVNAPDVDSFIAGHLLVLQKLADTYREHLEAAGSAANAMEIRILQRLLPDVEREIGDIGKLQHLLQIDHLNNYERVEQWIQYLGGIFKSAGEIGGLSAKGAEMYSPYPGNIRFEWPSPMIFDDRLHIADLGSYDSKLTSSLEERRIGEFEVYFNELYAAAIVATVIYESWKITAPRQYFLDIAHHFWDEVRHAEFGAIRLRELGIEPSKINMVLYEQSQLMPFLHRFCHLTLGLEIFFMPRKTQRVRYYQEQGDTLSQLFADVDWSEEMNHVRYGKRWIEYFLQDDARSVEDLQAEISKYLEGFSVQMPSGAKAPW